MELLNILRTLRRHWVLILALTVVGGIIGAASAQLNKKSSDSKTFYKATTTLVVDLSQRSNTVSQPFQSLDQSGVGMLVKMGIEKGRQTNPNLKVGICGEHGGEAESVKFCHRAGMNYVSCSPYRVPVARLAAAQAALEAEARDKQAAAQQAA